MEAKPKIIVRTSFINPHHGGIEETLKVFQMSDGEDAEREYFLQKQQAKKSGGMLEVQIQISLVDQHIKHI